MSKIITPAALRNRSVAELQALHRKAQQQLAASHEDSAERAAAIASLENIQRALHAKLAHSGPRL